jgi:hypothetical protein
MAATSARTPRACATTRAEDREGDLAGRALQEPGIELVLERADRAGDRGLRDAERRRCVGERPLVDDGHESTQVAQLQTHASSV